MTGESTPPSRGSWTEISDVGALVELIGEPLPHVAAKTRTALVPLDIDWLAASPFCMLGTADADGNVDVSPKGDPAGSLVHVLDEHTIALAERPGNKLAFGYRNVLANPHVGLTFLIPGRGDTLRINGRATLVRDAPFFDALEVKGHRPLLGLVVDIEEVFHHCAKAFLRSKLWEPASWDPDGTVPRRAVIAQEVDHHSASLAELDAYYGPAYSEKLYTEWR